MIRLSVLYLLLFVILTKCNAPKEEVFWVQGFKVENTNKQQVFAIQEGSTLRNEAFTPLNKNIEGFNFEEGYLKKIEVKEEANQYILLREIEKKKDYRIHLNGDWILKTVFEIAPDITEKKAVLKMNLNKMKLQGKGYCNDYEGNIRMLNFNTVHFSIRKLTKKTCLQNDLEQLYFNTLENTNTYLIKGKNVYFYDATGKKTLSFTKQ